MVVRVAVSIVLTLVLFVISRAIGPNREYTVTAEVDGFVLSHTAPRGHEFALPGERDLPEDQIQQIGEAAVKVQARPADGLLPLRIQWKLQGAESWESRRFASFEIEEGESGQTGVYTFAIPGHRWTSRVLYRFAQEGNPGEQVVLAREGGEPMMIKFKGPVPAWILIPHILFMFGAICFLLPSMWGAGTLARGGANRSAPRLAWWAWACMFAGGVVPFGIPMNYYAFDVLWEAVPFGRDITDNKTQVALVFWGLAALLLTRKPGRHAGAFALAAGALTLALYLIPHSL